MTGVCTTGALSCLAQLAKMEDRLNAIKQRKEKEALRPIIPKTEPVNKTTTI